MDTDFFVLISFLIFAYIFYRKLWPGLAGLLDEHIAVIKKQFYEKQEIIREYEKLEMLNQQRLRDLQGEIERIKANSLEKIEFLKQALDADMESLYLNRQKSAHQTIKRIQKHHRASLQSRCVDEIFAKVNLEIKEKPYSATNI